MERGHPTFRGAGYEPEPCGREPFDVNRDAQPTSESSKFQNIGDFGLGLLLGIPVMFALSFPTLILFQVIGAVVGAADPHDRAEPPSAVNADFAAAL